MAVARELILPLRGALVPVPAQPQEGVCSLCHSSATAGFPHCSPCHEAARVDPPEILPITLSVHGELIHDHLRNYKDSRSATVRDRMSLRLAGLLAVFMADHGECVGEWEYATCVPSARRVALEPVIGRIGLFAGRYRQVLEAQPPPPAEPDVAAEPVEPVRPVRPERAAPPDAGARALDPAHFAVTGDVTDHRILLLDDTFVSGAKLFSATAALRQHGARVVGPVVIGRHIQRSWPPSGDLLSWVEERPWDESRCARCAGERRRGTLF